MRIRSGLATLCLLTLVACSPSPAAPTPAGPTASSGGGSVSAISPSPVESRAQPTPTATATAPSPARPTGEPYRLSTHCGIEHLDYHGVWYLRVGGALDDGSGNPPRSWDNPLQQGFLAREGDRLIFTDDRGHREVFARNPDPAGPRYRCA